MFDSNDDNNANNINKLPEYNDLKISNKNNNTINLVQRNHKLTKTTSEIADSDELNVLNYEKNDENLKLSPKFLKTLRRRSKTYSGEEIQTILNTTNFSESSDKYCVANANNINEIVEKDNNDSISSIVASNLTTSINKSKNWNNNLEVKLINPQKNNEVSLSTSRRFHFFVFLIIDFNFLIY
jgi:hypothetical protein